MSDSVPPLTLRAVAALTLLSWLEKASGIVSSVAKDGTDYDIHLRFDRDQVETGRLVAATIAGFIK